MIFNKKPIQISFEFFPPKTPEGNEMLIDTVNKLAKSQPAFFSVTFGAGGSTRLGTLETVKRLQQFNNITIAPHVSCIGEDHETVLKMVEIYKKLNIKRLVVLRGDLPAGVKQTGKFKFANELVSFIREVTDQFFHIDVAAYPEIHPQAKSSIADLLNLKRKQDAGANSAITQYFFNADAYFYYLDECAKQGIHIPIVPGIMPITTFKNLVHFSNICGAEIPRWIHKRLELYKDDPESIHAFGLEVVCDLCQTLLSGGAPGIHFYTLNKATPTQDLLIMLGLIGSDHINKKYAQGL